MSGADLLLHPIRLRIVQAFLGDRALTTTALRSELPDVAPASLYRQVARLVEAGVLAVVAERRIRGAVERTYILRTAAAAISAADLAKMTADQHRQAFLAFVAGLIADFDRYVSRGNVDLVRDGVGYRLMGLWLSDNELTDLSRDMFTVHQPCLANGPKRGRTRRILATIVLPGSVAAPTPNAKRAKPRKSAALKSA
ncbi:MAG: helix-turn-helix domain-containing protein [Candidatus Dormibacteraeota bacterium]|nr:helix-turn-helix domain-containing protein [Candidatus Dormibacteraeota bacterium]